MSRDTTSGRAGLARGTPSWVAPVGLVGLGAIGLATRVRGRARAGALLVAGAGAAVTAFFRDPERAAGEGVILAAADGVVSEIARELDGRVRIATFMGLQNVHVNRAPLDGVVRDLEHHPGGYRPALYKDSALNERLVWTLDTALGEVRLVQIAGLLARRIIPYRQPGDRIERGQRIGMIRFGSRVDVTLPAGLEAAVSVGQRVRAGQTRLDR